MAAGPLLLAGAFTLVGPVTNTPHVAMGETEDGMYVYVEARHCRQGYGPLRMSEKNGSNLHVAALFVINVPGEKNVLAKRLCRPFGLGLEFES
jgi:hypothetical protein